MEEYRIEEPKNDTSQGVPAMEEWLKKVWYWWCHGKDTEKELWSDKTNKVPQE